MWRLWLSEPFQLASASVLLCDHLQHLQSHGPLVRGDLGEHEERTSIIHAVKMRQNFAWYGTFFLKKNTGPKLVQFWVVNSTKLKWIRRVPPTNYISFGKISGGVSEMLHCSKLNYSILMSYHVTSFEDPIEGKVFVGLVESSSDAWRGGVIQGGPPQFIKAG